MCYALSVSLQDKRHSHEQTSFSCHEQGEASKEARLRHGGTPPIAVGTTDGDAPCGAMEGPMFFQMKSKIIQAFRYASPPKAIGPEGKEAKNAV